MIEVDRRACDGCATCVGVCPADALMIVDELAVDPSRCTGCGRCVRVCPFGALCLDAAEAVKET